MKSNLMMLMYTFLLLLASLFLAGGVDDVDASESPMQTMSTGETPTAFVRDKIDSHDVSRRQSSLCDDEYRHDVQHLYNKGVGEQSLF
jgi:hypothetical protein